MAGGAAAGVGQPGTQGGMPQAGTGQAGTQTGMPQQGAGMAQQGSMPMGSLPNFGGGAFTPGMAQQGTGIQNPPAGTSPFYGGAATMADDFRGQQGSGMPFGQVLQNLGMNRPQGMPQGPVLDEGMRSPFAPPVQQMAPQGMPQGMNGFSQTPQQRLGVSIPQATTQVLGVSIPQATAQMLEMEKLLAGGQIPPEHKAVFMQDFQNKMGALQSALPQQDRAAFAQDYQSKVAEMQRAMQGAPMPQRLMPGQLTPEQGMQVQQATLNAKTLDESNAIAEKMAQQFRMQAAPTAQSIAQNISPGIAGLQSALTGRPAPTPTPAPALTRPTTQLVRPAPVARTPTPAAKPVVAPKPPIKQTPITTKKSMAR